MFGRRKPEDSIVDRLARNAERAGLGQKPRQQGQAQTPQPGAQAPTLQPMQAPVPQQAQPAKRPRKAFGATRAVARGVSGIWRLALTLMDLAVVAIVAGVVVLVLHGLIASNSLHVPASVGHLIDALYRLVIQASGVVARHIK